MKYSYIIETRHQVEEMNGSATPVLSLLQKEPVAQTGQSQAALERPTATITSHVTQVLHKENKLIHLQ